MSKESSRLLAALILVAAPALHGTAPVGGAEQAARVRQASSYKPLPGESSPALPRHDPPPFTYESGEPDERMPRVGQCFATRVLEVDSRITGVADSGTTILYGDGHAQVSYDRVVAAERSRRGDPVRLCAVSLPEDCPRNDFRGVMYQAFNLRTHRTWRMLNAEHHCGGA